MSDTLPAIINPMLMMLNANIDLQLKIGGNISSTANLANTASISQVANENQWASGASTAADAWLDDASDGGNGSLQTYLTNHGGKYPEPLEFQPTSQTNPTATANLMFYNNAQVQLMITYFAGLAANKTGDTLTQIQLGMQPWTNAGQAANAQSSNQQTSAKNTVDTLTQGVQAGQGALQSAVSVGSDNVSTQGFYGQILSSGTS